MARPADPCELSCSIVVERPITQCWDAYTNSALLAEWAPSVSSVEYDSTVIELNSQRKCYVRVDGRDGHTVELCTAIEPLKRIEFIITEETFGFAHMLTSYGFNVSFDVDEENSLIIMQTRYVPKKIFASVMSSKATQQQLLRLMTENLNGFKNYAEASIN